MMTKRMFWATMLASTCLLPASLQADGPLPTDPTVVAGDITITNPTATQLMLMQAGQYGIVDWGSFSIDAGYGVEVQNGNGATLNRVIGGDLSAIMGSLSATGSVYLVNQNGIVVGADGVVNTGGNFIASTLDIANGDFLDGGDNVFAGESAAYVINLGSVSSLGGDVGILARNVVNEGTITAPDGTVGLIAGREVLMRDAAVADGLFSVRLGGDDTSVTEAGSIRAAAAELRANGGNVYALAGNTEGIIAATGVERVNGRVFLTAGDGGEVKVEKTVKATDADGSGGTIIVDGSQVGVAGVLDVTGLSGGEVRITSRGTTDFSGEILAFGKGGAGGFVEVSGRQLSFTGRADTGGGTVLIDPDNIEITDFSALLGGASVLTTATIQALLATGDLIISTDGVDTEAGTIAITSELIYSSPFSLSLLAHGDILVFSSIQNGDLTGGDVNLVAGWDGATGLGGFDFTVFDGADLASQTIFGNFTEEVYSYNGGFFAASGTIAIGDTGNFGPVAVGAANGATRAYANNLVIQGTSNPDGRYGLAMLGYNANDPSDGMAINGDITVRATGDITVTGGRANNAAAQIGHVGYDSGESLVDVSSDSTIFIEGLGNLTLQAGESSGGEAYAMIGNGAYNNFGPGMLGGARAGDITIDIAGELSIADSATFDTAWIGHGSRTFGFGTGDIFLTAAAFDTSSTASVGSGGEGTLDVYKLASTLLAGNVTATATDSSVNLIGDTFLIDCECAFITSPNDLVVQASGDILLDADFFFSNEGGGSIALAAGANFQNNAGADAFGSMGTGRWLVYSTRPDQDSGDIGTLSGISVATDLAFDPNDPFNPNRAGTSVFSGNGLIYTAAPTVTVADATMTYGGALTLPGFTVTVDGVAVDEAEWGFSIDSIFVNEDLVTRSLTGNINAGTYVDALDFTWSTLASITGNYDFLFISLGDLTVDQATLTAAIIGTPTKTYDGTDVATLTAANFLLTGFVEGEDASVDETTGTYASPNVIVAAGNTVTATLGADDFTAGTDTDLANYILPTTATGAGVIDPATLTGSIIGTPTKTYDSTTDAILTAANFQLNGFVAGEGGTVGVTTGFYDTANASVANNVTVNIDTGDIVGTGTTLMSNYILPDTLTGAGMIDPATLTATIIGTPTKVYDGTTAATLTAANFLLSGFFGDDGGTVETTSGTYASANASATNAVTATLAAGDFTAAGGTNLANYVLPTTATGNGIITQATLTGSIIGTPTKVYDGTTAATLTAANFLLSGFVGSDGATVTETAGTYATPNATTGTTVTATLTAGDFSATGATVLANYILPTTVSGIGAIDQASLTATIIGTPTKVYDGTTTATLTAANFLLTGFVAGDGATVTETAGTYASANASGTNAVTATLTATDFTAVANTILANYILPTTATGNGVISQATLTGSFIGVPTKTYDGTTTAFLTAADFLLSGFVAGEGATVTETAGTYASANAGTEILVTVTLGAGDFAATGGTNLANYVLPVTLTGTGTIDRALLTASIVGLPTKPFDGSISATLTAANFLLSGFVAGEGATVTQTVGTYATPAAGVTNTVTADLAAGDIAADAGTSLANYILPTRAIGPGLIDAAPLPQPGIPGIPPLETFPTTPLGEPSGPATGIELINEETTQRILDEIRAGSAFCKALVRQEYVIDCLSDRLQSVADGLSAVGEYSEVRAALEDAARQLHALALANASQDLAAEVMRAGGRRSSRPLTAVSTEALGAANAQAAAIIEGAELVLLRSSSGSERRAEAFTQVAQVVNSTKVLLRSS